jgi:hypothetical protein
MRISGQELATLESQKEFTDYYGSLTALEAVEELRRLPVSGDIARVCNQYMALHRCLVECAVEGAELTEKQRTALIRICIDLRDDIEKTIAPGLHPAEAEWVRRACTALDDYVRQWTHFPKAAAAILNRNRQASGPFDMGVIGQALAGDADE